MDGSGTQTIATFHGTLVRRSRAPGRPFAQLIFREAGKDWLCLTSNLQHAAALKMGGKYSIEGVFKSLGEHHYIHEPNIVPLARQIAKRRWWIALAIGLAILLTAGGIVFAATHHDAPHHVTFPDPVQSSDPDAAASSATDTATNPSPSTTTDTSTTNTAPTVTAGTPPPANNPPANNNPVVPPPPPPTPTAPAAPSDLAAVSAADGLSVTLSWTASSGADSYQIWRDNVQIGTSGGAGYTDANTAPGQPYSYYVVAVDTAHSLSSGPSNAASVTTDNPNPGP